MSLNRNFAFLARPISPRAMPTTPYSRHYEHRKHNNKTETSPINISKKISIILPFSSPEGLPRTRIYCKIIFFFKEMPKCRPLQLNITCGCPICTDHGTALPDRHSLMLKQVATRILSQRRIRLKHHLTTRRPCDPLRRVANRPCSRSSSLTFVRSASVETATNITTRSSVKLCLLEAEPSERFSNKTGGYFWRRRPSRCRSLPSTPAL